MWSRKTKKEIKVIFLAYGFSFMATILTLAIVGKLSIQEFLPFLGGMVFVTTFSYLLSLFFTLSNYYFLRNFASQKLLIFFLASWLCFINYLIYLSYREASTTGL